MIGWCRRYDEYQRWCSWMLPCSPRGEETAAGKDGQFPRRRFFLRQCSCLPQLVYVGLKQVPHRSNICLRLYSIHTCAHIHCVSIKKYTRFRFLLLYLLWEWSDLPVDWSRDTLYLANKVLLRVARGSKFSDPTRPDPLIYAASGPDPTRSPIHNGKSCKTNNELKLLCAHTHECATQIRYASTRSRFHWLLISPARMPQRRHLNTDAYQTPPFCSQINCTYYSLGANERIASSLCVFCTPIFTALHAMQTRSSNENSVRLSVRPSVCPSHACIVTKR